MKMIWLSLGFLVGTGFVACSTVHTIGTKATKPQEVVFTETEVPYIQAVKKDGEVSAIIVDTTNSVMAAK